MTRKVQCLVCDGNLYIDENNCIGMGGTMTVEFGFGSCHDQMKDWGGTPACFNPKHPEDKLLACDQVVAYLCDGCFRKKRDKFQGFNITVNTSRTQVIESGQNLTKG